MQLQRGVRFARGLVLVWDFSAFQSKVKVETGHKCVRERGIAKNEDIFFNKKRCELVRPRFEPPWRILTFLQQDSFDRKGSATNVSEYE